MKKQIYQEIYSTESPQNAIIANVKLAILNSNAVDTDYITVTPVDSKEVITWPAEIVIWRYRDETDEELQKRELSANREKAVYVSMTTTTVIDTKELDELREKAAKYDSLCR